MSDECTVEWSDAYSFNCQTFPRGQKQIIDGTIVCSNELKSITAGFYKGESCWGPQIAVEVGGNRYDLIGSAIDMNLKFSDLPIGNYDLVFTVDYYANGKTEIHTKQIVASFTIG